MTADRVATKAQATRVYASRWAGGQEQMRAIGWAAKVTYSDDTVATCQHTHRNPQSAQLRACAARLAVESS